MSAVEGKSFAFTGRLNGITRAQAEAAVRKLGGSISCKATGKTDFLVVGDVNKCPNVKGGRTSKQRCATEHGTKMMTEKQFRRMVGIGAKA